MMRQAALAEQAAAAANTAAVLSAAATDRGASTDSAPPDAEGKHQAAGSHTAASGDNTGTEPGISSPQAARGESAVGTEDEVAQDYTGPGATLPYNDEYELDYGDDPLPGEEGFEEQEQLYPAPAFKKIKKHKKADGEESEERLLPSSCYTSGDVSSE
jgi:hypothetical protein